MSSEELNKNICLKNSSFTEPSHHPKPVVPHELHAYWICFVILLVLPISLLCTKSEFGTILKTLGYNQSLLLGVLMPTLYHLTKPLFPNEEFYLEWCSWTPFTGKKINCLKVKLKVIIWEEEKAINSENAMERDGRVFNLMHRRTFSDLTFQFEIFNLSQISAGSQTTATKSRIFYWKS